MATFHPRESRYARREFLQRGAAGAFALSSMGTLLAACGGSDNGEFRPPELQLARPDNPVTHPYFDDNPMIASGLEPESGTLRIYNWNGYMWPRTKKDFAKEYGVKVEETFFATMDEAIAKISSGAVDFDVFFPTTDRMSRLVVGKSLQPLNRDYLPNLANVWPSVQDPWYDKGSRYTVPYVTWTTGIGYRTDKVSTTPVEPLESVRDLLGRGEQGQDVPPRRWPRRVGHMLLKNGINGHQLRGSRAHRAREERAQVTHRCSERQALDGRLHEPPRGPRMGAPDVVGKRDLGAVVSAGGNRSRGSRVLVPTQRRGNRSGTT